MDFEDIEDAIVTELKGKMPYLKTVETYAGQLEADIQQVILPFPAVFVAYGGSELEWLDGPNYTEKSVFSVLVAAKNAKGNAPLRKDAYGSYRMIKDVLAYLANQTLGLDMEKLQPTRVSLIYISKTMAIYAIDFKTDFDTAYTW